MSSLELRDVTVDYGRRTVLQPFTDRIAPGEWLGLIGPNGAGKSTLLRSIVGLSRRRGEVRVDGIDLDARSTRQRASLVAFVPQEPVLPAGMSVFDYTLLGRSPYIGYFARESRHDRLIVGEVLDALEMGALAPRHLDQLSGGERQRVVIARALAQEAPILLLDEPTSALDIGHQQQALELVEQLRRERGLTVVSAMHDLTLAGMYSDRLVLLHEGAVVAAGEAGEVLSADTLLEFYGVRVSVHRERDGTVVVIPRREPLA